jgi:dimethylhistidine N-methyltransferase
MNEAVQGVSEREAFLAHVHAGLGAARKWLSPMYFYDAEGSRLFEQICQQPEYYPTRVESGILERAQNQISRTIGDRALVVEPGSGSGQKTRTLLEGLDAPAGYVPVEISASALRESVEELAADFPGLPVYPLCADFTRPFSLPRVPAQPRRHVIFFPGSTVGNFSPDEASDLLYCLRGAITPNASDMPDTDCPEVGLLIGVDLRKDAQVLEDAYNDAAGVTERFNLNLLRRINRELGADFDLERFRHAAVWNASESRIEMHLVSQAAQTVNVAGRVFDFAREESILSECSYKYTLPAFERVAESAGWRRHQVWMDPREWFSLQYFQAA